MSYPGDRGSQRRGNWRRTRVAVTCDWRIAASTARLGMPAVQLGVIYAALGLRRFASLLGPTRTRQLFLMGQQITASRAFADDLVDDVVDPSPLADAAARAIAGRLSGQPLAVAGTRELGSVRLPMKPMSWPIRSSPTGARARSGPWTSERASRRSSRASRQAVSDRCTADRSPRLHDVDNFAGRRKDQPLGHRCRPWPGNQESLAVVYAEGPKRTELAERLDPLGDDHCPDFVCESE